MKKIDDEEQKINRFREIHGTIWKNHCISCRKGYDVDYIFDSRDNVSHCSECGKTVRPIGKILKMIAG